MYARISYLALALLIWASACAPVKVRWDYDPQADFARYHTFDWLPDNAGGQSADRDWDHPFVDKRIEQALITALKDKGFERTTTRPDLLVAYRFTVKQTRTVQVYDPPNPYWAPPPSQVQHLREGTLIVDLVDPETRQLVWRGWGVGDAEMATRPDLSPEYLRRAAKEILKNYPPY